MIFLGFGGVAALCFGVFVAVATQASSAAASAPNDMFHGYPRWLVVLVGSVIAALVLWLFGKLVKWAIWILIIVVLVGGLVVAGQMLLAG